MDGKKSNNVSSLPAGLYCYLTGVHDFSWFSKEIPISSAVSFSLDSRSLDLPQKQPGRDDG